MLVVSCQILVKQQEAILLSLILIAFHILVHFMQRLCVELTSTFVKTCVENEGGFGD